MLSLFLPGALLAQVGGLSLFDKLTDYETTDEQKVILSSALTDSLVKALNVDTRTLDSLGVRQLKMVVSPDSVLKIFTWYYALNDATAQYGGILVYKGRVMPLVFADAPILQNEKYTKGKWCGGIYYDIIPVEKRGKTYYTLLSWDGNDGVTYKKIADVLRFDRKGAATFGSPFFENGRRLRNRVIIEYSSKTSLMFEYDEAHDGIVANALMFNHDDFVGTSATYGASDVFNIYRYESDRWVLYPDVDLSFDREVSRSLRSPKEMPESGL